MRKEERIVLLNREVKEITDLLTGIQAFKEVPEVLIDLLYQKTLNLSEGVALLKSDKDQYPDLEDNPTDSATVMFPEVMEQVVEEESCIETEPTSEAQVDDAIIDIEESKLESDKEFAYTDFEGFKDVADKEESCESLEDVKTANDNSQEEAKEEVEATIVDEEVGRQGIKADLEEDATQLKGEENKEDKPIIKKVFEQVFRTHLSDSNVTAKKEDFRRLMTLNDRFLFQRELFHGDVGMLNHTIDVINDQDDPEVAKAYVREEFKWDEDNLTVSLFMEMIDRHFTE